MFISLHSNEFAVAVSALRSSDGAILDPDDRLADVVDDREQLAACLSGSSMNVHGTDHGTRLGLNLRGDGTSASSNSGSPSPDFLRHHNNQYTNNSQQPARKDIEVTGQEAGGIMADHLHGGLQVRRGSEPALNCISPGPHSAGSAHLLNEPSQRDYKVRLYLFILSLSLEFLKYLFNLTALVCRSHRRPFGLGFRRGEQYSRGTTSSVGTKIFAVWCSRIDANLWRKQLKWYWIPMG